MEQMLICKTQRSDTDNVEALLRLPVPNHEPSGSAKSADLSDAQSTVDSAYQSVGTVDSNNTVSAVASSPSDLATRVFPIPGKDVLRFLKSPDRKQQRHYLAVLSAIQARLQAAVARASPDGQVPWDKLVFQPMVVGKNEQEAKLHMAVLCEPDLAPILEEAFKYGPVQSELGIPNTDERLGYIVIPEPFEEVHAELPLDIFTLRRYHTEHNTNCGAPLFVMGRERRTPPSVVRQATFGGVIKVSFANDQTRYYGVTAGHVAKDARQHRHQVSTNDTSCENMTQGLFSLTAWLSNEEALSHPLDPDRLPGVTAQRTKPSHDWCLFEVRPTRRNKAVWVPTTPSETKSQSRFGTLSQSILIAERPTFNDDTSDPVLVLGAAAGTRSGVLSTCPASIWMSSCQIFVSVYVLQMDDDQKVTRGDSGAWVVHAAGPALYGYVVATNTFGEAYIVPANDAFENIRECLGATSVTLPTTEDLPIKPHIEPLKLPAYPATTETLVETESSGLHQIRPKLHRKKFWNPSLSKHKPINDPLYLKTLSDLNIERSLLEFFLEPSILPTSRWETQQERDFLNAHSIGHTQSSPRLYLDDRYQGCSERSGSWIAVDQVEHYLRGSKPWSYDLSNGCHRQLMFLPRLDAQILTDLLRQVTRSQAEALRHIVQIHATSAIGLRVHVKTSGVLAFRLQFDLPYFTFTSPNEDLAQNLNVGSKVTGSRYGLLRFARSVQERHTSVVISGCSSRLWFGYAIGSLGDAEDVLEDTSDFHDAAELDEGNEELDFIPDLFATAGCEPSTFSGKVMWDPRTYFLHTLCLRLETINQVNGYLLHKLKTGLGDLIREASDTHFSTLVINLEIASTIADVIDLLRDRLRMATRAWNEFSSRTGDILYFGNIEDGDGYCYLQDVEEGFNKLRSSETEADILKERSRTVMHQLQLLMTFEGQKVGLEGNVLQRRIVQVNLQTLRHGELAAISARGAQVVAEDMARTSRVNVHLALMITAIMMALVYFGSERGVFAFERSPQTFWISLLVLVPSLLLLTWALHTVERYKEVVTRRLRAQLDRTETRASQVSRLASSAWDHHMSDAETLHEKPGTIA